MQVAGQSRCTGRGRGFDAVVVSERRDCLAGGKKKLFGRGGKSTVGRSAHGGRNEWAGAEGTALSSARGVLEDCTSQQLDAVAEKLVMLSTKSIRCILKRGEANGELVKRR